jgi:hypothetical protein
MYWNNLKSEFYGAKLNGLGPRRFRLVVAVLTIVDYVMQRLTQGSIFNLSGDDFDLCEHRRPSRPELVKRSEQTLQRS